MSNKRSMMLEARLEGRFATMKATGTTNKHVGGDQLAKIYGQRLAALVESGNSDAIALANLIDTRRRHKSNGSINPALLESVQKPIAELSNKLGLNANIAIDDSNQLLNMMSMAVSPANFDSPRHLKKHLTEGLLLNVTTMASQLLGVPTGQYMVSAVDEHTMLVPTSEIRNEDAGVLKNGNDTYEILTRDLIGCWNKLERVIGEAKSSDDAGGDYKNPASGPERVGRPALKKKVEAAGGVRATAERTGLSPGDVSKHVNNREFEISGESARQYMDAISADPNDLYKYGSVSIFDYDSSDDDDKNKDEDKPKRKPRSRHQDM